MKTVFSVLIIFLLVPGCAKKSGNSRIAVSVSDSDNKTMKDITAILHSVTGKKNDRDVFEFENIPAGFYDLDIIHNGRDTFRIKDLTVVEKVAISIDVDFPDSLVSGSKRIDVDPWQTHVSAEQLPDITEEVVVEQPTESTESKVPSASSRAEKFKRAERIRAKARANAAAAKAAAGGERSSRRRYSNIDWRTANASAVRAAKFCISNADLQAQYVLLACFVDDSSGFPTGHREIHSRDTTVIPEGNLARIFAVEKTQYQVGIIGTDGSNEERKFFESTAVISSRFKIYPPQSDESACTSFAILNIDSSGIQAIHDQEIATDEIEIVNLKDYPEYEIVAYLQSPASKTYAFLHEDRVLHYERFSDCRIYAVKKSELKGSSIEQAKSHLIPSSLDLVSREVRMKLEGKYRRIETYAYALVADHQKTTLRIVSIESGELKLERIKAVYHYPDGKMIERLR